MTSEGESEFIGSGAPLNPEPPRHSRPARPPLAAAERRQRNVIIALSIGGVLVLIAGMIAFVATRGNGAASAPSTVLPVTTPTADDSVPSTSVPASTTTEATTTVPPTTVVIVANADAGDDLAVDQSVEFTLVATDLAEGTPSAAVRWTQTAGPDVTAGTGSLRGAEAAAVAPSEVTTLAFTLEVAGTDGVATDDVIVRVFERADGALFVDGELGNDAGDGSMAAPLRTLTFAAQSSAGRDIYLRSSGTYDTTAATLDLVDGVSLYGGFGEDWQRETNSRSVIDGAAIAIRTEGSTSRTISGVEVTASDAAPAADSAGVVIRGAGLVRVLDSRIVGGDAGAGVDGGAGGRSSGMVVDGASEVRVERSTLNAGDGGSGGIGAPAADGAPTLPGESGGDGNGRDGGAGGGTGAVAGGRGGDGGNTSAGGDAPGGGDGGRPSSPEGRPGTAGRGGDGGAGGHGGVGPVIADDGASVAVGRIGAHGDDGVGGAGGTGGGGGNGPIAVDGGGGAGGGAGGAPTVGAAPGGGGGGSIGLWAVDVDRLVIIESLVAGGQAGNGGAGAVAQVAQDGGPGGQGAAGVDGLLADGGSGGGGAGGGAGGTGGQGGGGAGGPSYGLLTTNASTVEVSATTVRGGAGGAGAAGGVGGVAGLGGSDGTGRTGGLGGAPSVDVTADGGTGASGGDAIGWLDDDAAERVLDGAQFIEGTAGRGGNGAGGSGSGNDGVEISSGA